MALAFFFKGRLELNMMCRAKVRQSRGTIRDVAPGDAKRSKNIVRIDDWSTMFILRDTNAVLRKFEYRHSLEPILALMETKIDVVVCLLSSETLKKCGQGTP